jgi:hypothetical protein
MIGKVCIDNSRNLAFKSLAITGEPSQAAMTGKSRLSARQLFIIKKLKTEF